MGRIYNTNKWNMSLNICHSLWETLNKLNMAPPPTCESANDSFIPIWLLNIHSPLVDHLAFAIILGNNYNFVLLT